MKTVTLSTPIKVNGADVSRIVMRPPLAGDMRGLKMSAIGEFDVTSVVTLVPRIAVEPVTREALDTLTAADLLTLCAALSGFFTGETDTPSPTMQ